MLDAKPEQFKINDEGKILYQSKLGNPLPGEPVAVLRKGSSILSPLVEPIVKTSDEVQAFLQGWLEAHINTVLEPLVALHNDSELTSPVKDIAEKVYGALGILPRTELEDLIVQLDTDTRRILRSKRVRLGPVLVFQPDLNKPAAVRLRGMLWSLFNDKPLPAPLPNDGVVSFKIEPDNVDRAFHQVIGYPVYGPRAIRIDMLDRVINSIYDQAQGGKFQAKHEMAEWFGCPIQDLYDILEAMGHTKIYDPLEDPAKAELRSETDDDTQVGEGGEKVEPTEQAVAPLEEKAEGAKTEAPDAQPKGSEKQEQVKPELATFRLKKGKASGNASGRKSAPRKFDKPKKKGKRSKSADRPKKVMSAEAKVNPEDNPFAVLGQLKAGNDSQ